MSTRDKALVLAVAHKQITAIPPLHRSCGSSPGLAIAKPPVLSELDQDQDETLRQAEEVRRTSRISIRLLDRAEREQRWS